MPKPIRTNVVTAIMKSRKKQRRTLNKVQSAVEIENKNQKAHLFMRPRAEKFIE